jgi:hypothetical protein
LRIGCGRVWIKRDLKRGFISESLFSYNKIRGWFLNGGVNWRNFRMSEFIGECGYYWEVLWDLKDII